MKQDRYLTPSRLIMGTTILLLLLPAVGRAAAPDDYPRNPDIDIQHYTFRFMLADESDSIDGVAKITVHFRTAGVSRFTLDLIGRSGSMNRAGVETGMVVESVLNEDGMIRLEHSHADDRLLIQLAEPSKAGDSRSFLVNYHGVPADGLIISENKFGERTFFGDNWPNRARHWLPAIDHPYEKASCEFLVIAPDAYQVVANGRLIEETDLDNGTRLTHWYEDAPLPTKVMVIGVSRFAVQHLPTDGGVPIQTWVYPQDRDGGFESFAIARQVMDYFEKVIGPFSYEKLANVQSRTRYGGMENAGAIFYHEGRGDPVSWSESLIVHEMAHQWFGDSASEADWHHIWLSEGFATYFTEVYMEHFYGADRFRQGMAGSRQRVLSYYYGNPESSRQSPHTDSPLVDTTLPIGNGLLSTNSYQKGSWILHMLRHELGDEEWWKGIREYYRRYENGNALTRDFRAVMEEMSGENLELFFQQWVFGPGQPDIRGSWIFDSEEDQIFITLDQVQESNILFDAPIEFGVVMEEGEEPVIHTFKMDDSSELFTIPVESRPFSVILDPHVWLLARVDFNEKQ
ncbi:M1 family aminopeptidase [Candidatus Zixiibacteriota bacterium]